MGIVNINADSFCGDGTLDFDVALEQAGRQLGEGADIIDIGAESARTNRAAIPVAEELRRFRGLIDRWDDLVRASEPRDAAQVWPPVLSVNSWRTETITKLLDRPGIDLINDMSALPDASNAAACARAGVALLVMHSVGEPKVPHLHQQWPDVLNAVDRFFEEKIALAISAGMAEESLILDPGIDFAKQRDDNLRIYRHLDRLTRFGRPLLVPVSRKTVIGEVLDLPDPASRDAGTVACIASSVTRGASIFRVHHVAAAWQAVKTLHAIGADPSAGLIG